MSEEADPNKESSGKQALESDENCANFLLGAAGEETTAENTNEEIELDEDFLLKIAKQLVSDDQNVGNNLASIGVSVEEEAMEIGKGQLQDPDGTQAPIPEATGHQTSQRQGPPETILRRGEPAMAVDTQDQPGAYPVYHDIHVETPHRDNHEQNERSWAEDTSLAPPLSQGTGMEGPTGINPSGDMVVGQPPLQGFVVAPARSGHNERDVAALEEGRQVDARPGEAQQAPRFQPPLIEGIVEPTQPFGWKKAIMAACSLSMVVVIVVLALGLAGTFDSKQEIPVEMAPSSDKLEQSVLQRVKERGYLKCAIRYFHDSLKGFDMDVCKAIAGAILGDSAQVKHEGAASNDTVFLQVSNGTFDMMVRGITHNMQRQVAGPTGGIGLSFSRPYFYDCMRLAGDPFYLKCAEDGFQHLRNCSDIRICVWRDTSHSRFLEKNIPNKFIVPKEGMKAIRAGLADGGCNIAAFEGISILEKYARDAGYVGDYEIGTQCFSKEPLGAVMGQSDQEFTAFVNSVLQALFAAEQHNITQAESDMMPQTSVFGEEYEEMFRRAIRASGNFGEIYERHFVSTPPRGSLSSINNGAFGEIHEPHFASTLPRGSLNSINNGASGLLYSHPFGIIDYQRDESDFGTTMAAILDRGVVHCGVRYSRPGFATTTKEKNAPLGVDVDYCRAIAAGLFSGPNRVVLVELTNSTDAFAKLASGEVDVVAGATWKLENFRDPKTGVVYSFSKPYFYGSGGDGEEENCCLATASDDHDWSSFVYWIVEAITFAEEEGINSTTSIQMPEVLLYGPSMKRIFRDAILAVGSYAEIYERNLQTLIPRAGRNVLNPGLNGPQHYVLPGII
ncbi:extracellular solute-binding protein [Seminavis robusta]|uniref:Extracellular solute-binding protein n=1 Tax=Seminavis robusta TaxID=568900 RepID=A0A9N8DMD9_9STRA|nr:extracellular solute-binding protein [Seminavis robusta]|eukprot:Sro159_g071780.1 extracellular solute-binding protein (845) ;mRNA; r:32694-35421